MDHADQSDDDLIAVARDDSSAFAALYRRHSEAVLRYLVYRTGSGEHAADLTAEVFAAAFEASARYRRNGTPARAWLFGIANHKLADSFRHRRIDDRARRRLGVQRLDLDDRGLQRAEE